MKCLPKSVNQSKSKGRGLSRSRKWLSENPCNFANSQKGGIEGNWQENREKQRELSLDKPPGFERYTENTFLKKFGHCMLTIDGTSKIHVFRFYLPVQHRDQYAVPAGNQSL
jgi:hypothetical protein